MIFVTHNKNKFLEVQNMFMESNLTLEWNNVEYEEVQADTTEEVSLKSCIAVSKLLDLPFFLEDSGLYIESLGGFPGPYSSYVLKTIGLEGILRLLEPKEKRALFTTVVSLFTDGKVLQFSGILNGSIATQPSGQNGFGYDPIFIPESSKRTLAEISLEEKNKISHRSIAIRKLIEYLLNR